MLHGLLIGCDLQNKNISKTFCVWNNDIMGNKAQPLNAILSNGSWFAF